MFSALKKLTKSSDERCPAPVPMSSSLQKKFSRGVHYNMKILIKGDRNVGKSCLLQRLQGGPFIEEYVATEQIQVAPIHWTYKTSDHIVKVEVWEVVDKGRAKKKPPIGLKLENQDPTAAAEDDDTPVLDATFLDVYKNANGVILMFDITKPWTFDYVVKEISKVPLDLPVVVLGNHCDMQHHRQVHSHHIEQALNDAKHNRTAPLRYAESSMRNGFGLRLLHKFLNVPFLRLQRTSLLEQLQRNQKDIEEVEQELTEFQLSEESQYDTFVDRLTNKRRANAGQPEARANERSPSIVIGAGKPIIPPNVNPLMSAQSLNPMGIKAMNSKPDLVPPQRQYVSADLLKPRHVVSMEMTPPKKYEQDSAYHTPSSTKNQSSSSAGGGGGDLDEFYAGALDTSFLEDMAPGSNVHEDAPYDSDSDEDTINPMVNVDHDDLDLDCNSIRSNQNVFSLADDEDNFRARQIEERFGRSLSVREREDNAHVGMLAHSSNVDDALEFRMWAEDSSVRRSPEGGEDPDLSKDKNVEEKKSEKKHKKKKSKDKDSDKSEKKKNKHKKTKSDKKPNAQSGLLLPDDVDGKQTANSFYDYDEDYDS